jgi:predicted methyltransferase
MTIQHRQFDDYEEYVQLQGGKARAQRDHLLKVLPRDTASFRKVFADVKRFLRPGPVLCLGARSGAEVNAANDTGFKGSVGLDLHPVGKNVQQGDWHAMPFADASFPNVFCNSLDHCLSLDKLAAEVQRVLTPDGIFYVMASDRDPHKTLDKWIAKGGNEALYWQTSDDLRDALVARGFKLVNGKKSGKWGCYVLTKV